MKKRILVVLLIMLCLMPCTEGCAKDFQYRYYIKRSDGTYRVDKDEELDAYADPYISSTVTRKSFGLVAKNVATVHLGKDGMGDSSVMISRRDKKNIFYQVDLLKKVGENKDFCYKSYEITKKAKAIYPVNNTAIFYRDKKDQICYTGVSTCGWMFCEHKSKKDCVKEENVMVKDKVLLSGVKKC